jgi:hypothetical protein
MPSRLHIALRVLFLGVYILVSVAIGALHTDDMPAAGDGHHAVSTCRVPSLQNSAGHGVCLACQFAAGHIAVDKDQIPAITPEVTVSFSALLVPVASLAPLRSVRGPPSLLFM